MAKRTSLCNAAPRLNGTPRIIRCESPQSRALKGNASHAGAAAAAGSGAAGQGRIAAATRDSDAGRDPNGRRAEGCSGLGTMAPFREGERERGRERERRRRRRE